MSEEQRAKPLLLKFGLDNAKTSQSHKTKQEIGGMELILPGSTLSRLKSPRNCHVWGIYKGKENADDLQTEFGISLTQINALNGTIIHNSSCTTTTATTTNISNTEGKIIDIKGKQYQLQPLLVTDMACLVQLLNLTEVYAPTSTIKCCWCDCTATSIHDFSIEAWPFRAEDKWQEREKTVCVSMIFFLIIEKSSYSVFF